MKITLYSVLILAIIVLSANARSVLVDVPGTPASNFVFNVPYTQSFRGRTNNPDETALQFVQDRLGLAESDVVVKNIVPSKATGITSVYLRQKVNGIEVANADINININKEGRVISYGENIFRGAHPRTSPLSTELTGNSLSMTPADGFKALTAYVKLPNDEAPLYVEQSERSMNDAVRNNRPIYIIRKPAKAETDVPVRLSYIQTDNGLHLELVYSYELELKENWYNAHVSIDSGNVVDIADWVSDALYEVLNIHIADPLERDRELIDQVVHDGASPYGWHSNGANSYLDTRGNNVWAQENARQVTNIASLYRPGGGSDLTFSFPFYQNQAPAASKDAAISQLFHTVNMLHDTLYHYGFDEVSGNFQDNNGNKGGIGGDYCVANAQATVGTNNANFATPPDGRSGVMNMYLWTMTTPGRDGIFDLGIVAHEYGHGLSNRLTGGPGNSNCLPAGEPGGMGEGWSDILATVLRQKPENKRTDIFLMGGYATGGKGIRKFPYSTDMVVNPSTYSYIDTTGYTGVHAKGEVWAVIMMEVYWNLVDTLGFTPDLESASLSKGNTLFLRLMIEGMKVQPCRPTFLQARDAVIQAEAALTNGAYACQLWRGYAKRGLGVDARKVNLKAVDGYQVPSQC
jgi:hypothetical protein